MKPLTHSTSELASRLHDEMEAAGIEVLLDDRDERPGVKFADADLVGIPHRVTIGDRALKDGNVEYRYRSDAQTQTLPLDEIYGKLAVAQG